MAVCKKCGYNNPDDARYCGKCKEELMGVDPDVMRANMERVNEEFENDARATLDTSRLTFICDVCGKVNPINVPGKRCARCGKKMPRSAYLKAVKKMQRAGIITPPVDTAPVPVQQPAQQPAPVQQPQPRVEEAPAYQEPAYPQQQAQQVYRMSARPQPPQQNSQVIQPFVIVPYVSQSQPVYQYQSNLVYRFDEYSEEEKKKNQETLLRYQKERKEAELQRAEAEEERKREVIKQQTKLRKKTMKMAKKANYDPMTGQGGYDPYGSSNVRIAAIFSLLFAIASIFVLIFLDKLVPEMELFGVKITFALHQNVIGVYSVAEGLIAKQNALPVLAGDWMVLCGSAAFAIFMLAAALQSIIRIIKGHSQFKGLLFPILALVATIVAYVGCTLRSGAFDINALAALWPNYIYCAVIMVFVPLIMILIACLTKTDEKY